ncbi:5087_t:CDS:2, partial [Gigaspora margarita]
MYLSRQCISTYLEPRHSNMFVACYHYHPVRVALASITQTEMKPHIDEHYCLASVKTLAEVFVDNAIIISQDDKAKVSLDVLAVGRTFKTIQTINEPVSVADYDFSVGSKMKLIPSIYLIIDLVNSNNSFCLSQLAIFFRPKYFVGTMLLTHMSDLESIIFNQQFAIAIMKENKVKPVWVLLVDGEPDENPKYMKNIIQQSAYNSVKHSMASLFEKLAGIMLSIDEFRSHLDSQEKVLNKDLAYKNFEFARKSLCDIWERDNIHDQIKQPFTEIGSSSWEWIEDHTQICHYSLNIKKCKNPQCCNEYRVADIALLLDQNNRFLLPIMKGKDQHYINSIHTLQYYDKLKIL